VNQTLILYPMLALVGWTMLILSLTGFRRLTSRLHPREFALGESPAVPPAVSLPNRNFMNLLEVPVLFYVVTLTLYATHQATGAALALAWVFVGLRVCHSIVHLAYNNVMHRLGFFATGNFVLLALWAYLLVRLA
jgi:hypothetical protein